MEDEEGWVVWGSYAAVALADPRALQLLSASLGPVLGADHWQRGASRAGVGMVMDGVQRLRHQHHQLSSTHCHVSCMLDACAALPG